MNLSMDGSNRRKSSRLLTKEEDEAKSKPEFHQTDVLTTSSASGGSEQQNIKVSIDNAGSSGRLKSTSQGESNMDLIILSAEDSDVSDTEQIPVYSEFMEVDEQYDQRRSRTHTRRKLLTPTGKPPTSSNEKSFSESRSQDVNISKAPAASQSDCSLREKSPDETESLPDDSEFKVVKTPASKHNKSKTRKSRRSVQSNVDVSSASNINNDETNSLPDHSEFKIHDSSRSCRHKSVRNSDAFEFYGDDDDFKPRSHKKKKHKHHKRSSSPKEIERVDTTKDKVSITPIKKHKNIDSDLKNCDKPFHENGSEIFKKKGLRLTSLEIGCPPGTPEIIAKKTKILCSTPVASTPLPPNLDDFSIQSPEPGLFNFIVEGKVGSTPSNLICLDTDDDSAEPQEDQGHSSHSRSGSLMKKSPVTENQQKCSSKQTPVSRVNQSEIHIGKESCVAIPNKSDIDMSVVVSPRRGGIACSPMKRIQTEQQCGSPGRNIDGCIEDSGSECGSELLKKINMSISEFKYYCLSCLNEKIFMLEFIFPKISAKIVNPELI